MLVQISDKLQSSITNKINDMRDRELGGRERLPTLEVYPHHPQYQQIVGILEESVWGALRYMKEMMPEAWMTKTRRIDMYYVPSGIADRNAEDASHVVVGGDVLFPPDRSPYPDVFITEPNEFLDTLLAETIARAAEYNEVKHRYARITDQVLGFLRQHPSLNKALKALPELELYIPTEYMDRVNKESERVVRARARAPETPVVPVDVTLLTTTAVAHRVRGA